MILVSDCSPTRVHSCSAQNMSYVICCASLEVKYRKRGGGCKVLNDTSIQVSDIDQYLNGIMRKSNFRKFLSVKMIDIHQRPLRSADSDDSDDSGEETEEVEEEESVTSPAGGVEQ